MGQIDMCVLFFLPVGPPLSYFALLILTLRFLLARLYTRARETPQKAQFPLFVKRAYLQANKVDDTHNAGQKLMPG
jgi:hypothetical protein